jgi:hypothetical protein
MQLRRSLLVLVIVASLIAALTTAGLASASYQMFIKWGQFGVAEGEFIGPWAVATDLSGNVYVADSQNNRIQKFSSTGSFQRMWGWGVDDGSNAFQTCTSGCQGGLAGSGDGQFDLTYGVATDSSGNVYASDYNNNRIEKFSSTGSFLAKWGSLGAAAGQFQEIRAIATDSSDNVYAADVGNYRIQKFSSAGAFQRAWGYGVIDGDVDSFQICTGGCEAGFYGSGDGQLSGSTGIAADSSGNVYVSDNDTHRIQVFSSTGSFERMWGWGVDDGTNAFQICTGGCQAGIYGNGDGQFGVNNPYGVATDSSGNVYVGDSGRIQKFSGAGGFITKWGTPGSGDGQFGGGDASGGVRGVAVDSSGSVYVSDTANQRIQKFADAAYPYDHPVGASPVRVPLVPAFGGCTSANSTHGAPLNFPSCNPPSPASSTVKSGNGAVGSAWVVVCPTGTAVSECNESAGGFTSAMQPDMRVYGAVRDIQCRVTGTPSGCSAGSDYNPNGAAGPYTITCTTAALCGNNGRPKPFCAPSGASPSSCSAGTDVTLVEGLGNPSSTTVDPTAQCGTDSTCLAFASRFVGHGLRVTDRYNCSAGLPAGDPNACPASGSTSTWAATLVDIQFPVPLDCLATASAAVGSTCGVNTTANALVPGSVVAGKQAVVELGEITLLDSGLDGTRGSSDDERFAVQGIYVP